MSTRISEFINNVSDPKVQRSLQAIWEAVDVEINALRTLANELRTDHATQKTAIDETKTFVDEVKDDFANIIDETKTWDPGSLSTGTGETTNVTVTGAALGDFVMVAPPYDLQDCLLTGYVQATNTVEIRLQNETASSVVNLASGAWRVKVIPYAAIAALTATKPTAGPGTLSAPAAVDSLEPET